jgi:iron complex transport system substrate-binding protein
LPTSTTRRSAVALLAVLCLSLAACGSSKNAPDTASDTTAASATSSGGGTDDTGIRLQGVGEAITLDAPATKVVAIQWSHVEDLLALGVTPVGVADIKGYGTWVHSDPAIPASVTDIGDRQAPSTEVIRGLEPDLIIAGTDADADALDTLRDIAPVLVLDDAPESGTTAWEAMVTNFRTIATATGRTAEGTKVLDGLEQKIAEGKATLAKAKLSPSKVVLVQGDGTVDSPMFRLFNDGSLVVQIMTKLGVQNGWDGAEESYGFNTVSMEALTTITDAWFLPVVQPDALDAFVAKYAGSPLWQSLSFVKEDRIRPLGGDVWFFGGPLSAEYFIERLIAALEP